MKEILLLIFSYLLGAIPFGVIIAKVFSKVDPTKGGSGNIGATNVYRTAGKIPGILTLIADVLKGFFPVYVALKSGIDFQIVLFAGFFAIVGHMFPVYMKFKGGKGVATAIGVFVALTPLAVCVEVVIFVAMVLIWRYVSLASITCSILLPVILKLFLYFKIYSYPHTIVLFASTISILIIFKHRKNIERLIKGKEFKFGSK